MFIVFLSFLKVYNALIQYTAFRLITIYDYENQNIYFAICDFDLWWFA